MARQKIVELGLLDALSRLRSTLLAELQFGLFQNDFHPVQNSNIGHIVPATFSGYSGLTLATGWTAGAIDGNRAITTATAINWSHSGGLLGNWIYGFYAVNTAGVLVLAKRLEQTPALVEVLGVTVSVTPTFSARSEF